MCTVVIEVPEPGSAPERAVRLLAVRDEDPARPWQSLGERWPDRPGVIGVRDVRAGGAWLAADPAAGRLAVLLNRAEAVPLDAARLRSRGSIVLDAVAGAPPRHPNTAGFNLVEVDGDRVRVTTWDGIRLRTDDLAPGTHMIAHDDLDDAKTERIREWLPEFARNAPPTEHPAHPDAQPWWEEWMRVLERSATLGPADDGAIIRDNRAHGYPTLSLLACVASVWPGGADVRYAELDEPGAWNRLEFLPPAP